MSCPNCGCKGKRCICAEAGCLHCCGKCEKMPKIFIKDKFVEQQTKKLDQFWQKEFGNEVLNNTFDEIDK